MDKIIVKINCSTKKCDKIRDNGLFFETIAGALDIERNDVVEINDYKNNMLKIYDKSRGNKKTP